MRCKDLQFILPIYSDDALTEAEQAAAEQHMNSCPVCRQKLADLLSIRNELRAVARPQFPPAALHDLRRSVAARLERSAGRQMFQNIGDRRRWVDVWLMPAAVSSLSTLVLGFSLLWVVVSSEIRPQTGGSPGADVTSNTTILYPYAPPTVPVESDLNPFDYASSRADW